MTAPTRTRLLNQLTWVVEEADSRARRRRVLCELDGLLTQLEESNLLGYDIPDRVIAVLKRHGITPPRGTVPPDLIEAIFGVQEAYMRQAEQPSPAPPPPASAEMRKIAS